MASPSRGRVVIFKAPTDSGKDSKDAYDEILSNEGFDVLNVPVLEFEFVELDGLLTKLKRCGDYCGLIFSSPRCVKACERAIAGMGEENRRSLVEQWSLLKNFAVGEATANAAEQLGLNVEGKEAGNANALAEIIVKDSLPSKPFLQPIGSLTNNKLKLDLQEAGIEVDDIVVYRTKPHTLLRESVEGLRREMTGDSVHFLYFSPSGVKFTLPLLREMNFDFERVKFIAIGPTTEKCLAENGLKAHRTVSKPNPESTLEAFIS